MEKKNLSVAEYFHIIQCEYLQAEFRRKIYPSKADKAYYQRVMDGKRKKIEDIANRNRLDTIFTSDKKMKEIRDECFDRHSSVPKFHLTSEDIENYYTIGNEFSYHGDIWILDAVEGDDLILYSKKLEMYERVRKDQTSRIL